MQLAGLALGLALASPGVAVRAAEAAPPAGSPPQQRPEPYRRGGGAPLEFRGPGRDGPDGDVAEVAFAWFGPGDADHPEFGEQWRGAMLALEEENAAGGYVVEASDAGGERPARKPFRLLPVWTENPWQAAITELTRLVYERRLLAVIGGVDGATTHLAVQTALKARIPLVSPGSSDVTADHANVPWLFSLPASDTAQAALLAESLAERSGPSLALAAATDHDSHARLLEVQRALSRRRLAAVARVEFEPGEAGNPELARRLAAGQPAAVAVLAPASVAGRLVAALRRSGFGGTVMGGSTLATNAFRRSAGGAAEGVRALTAIGDGAAGAAFRSAYRRRWGGEPDEPAAHGYDAVRLLAAAARRAGPNRARIRDELRALSPWSGAAGDVTWNALGRSTRPPAWIVWRNGERLRESPGGRLPPRPPQR